MFPFYRRVNRLSRPPEAGRKRGKRERQPRHSGFVPLIVPDNSCPLSRYADLSRRRRCILLSRCATASQLKSWKVQRFYCLRFRFIILFGESPLSKSKRRFRAITGEFTSDLRFKYIASLFVNEDLVTFSSISQFSATRVVPQASLSQAQQIFQTRWINTLYSKQHRGIS